MSDSNWTESVKPLLGKNHYLDKLWREHQRYESELSKLDKIKWLTSEQEQSRRTLQRKKLHGKDKMLQLVQQLT